ncbi:hypothetical protein pb186bvf_014288 [Paramecium bursaria]
MEQNLQYEIKQNEDQKQSRKVEQLQECTHILNQNFQQQQKIRFSLQDYDNELTKINREKTENQESCNKIQQLSKQLYDQQKDLIHKINNQQEQLAEQRISANKNSNELDQLVYRNRDQKTNIRNLEDQKKELEDYVKDLQGQINLCTNEISEIQQVRQ